ncbi:uncharacterized protein VTP21DRAFT_6588 [Calcarisporiella thermophila]|uniref:uncharacterized protein n=1 Tax=Calcarisporiella thermophila TaxID=911321 RepID=UPI0037428EF9
MVHKDLLIRTPSGRLFAKNVFELFSALLVSIPIETNRRNFRSYHNTFTGENAVTNLLDLKITETSCSPDPTDPTRLVSTTTARSLGFTKDHAKLLCQRFMDATLISNATDKLATQFKEKGLYKVTQKGLYLLERHINKNNVAAAHLQALFGQAPPIKVLVLDRDAEYDLVLFGRRQLCNIFRKFAGSSPNNVSGESERDDASVSSSEADRNRGVQVKDHQFFFKVYPNTFHGQGAIDWLCDFTTTVSREEGTEIANEFMRMGLIEEVIDMNEVPGVGYGEIFYTKSILYRLTELGERLAGWRGKPQGLDEEGDDDGLSMSSSSRSHKRSKSKSGSKSSRSTRSNHMEETDLADLREALPTRKDSFRGDHLELRTLMNGMRIRPDDPKESSFVRLQQILCDERLLALFREFLMTNFCEENLAFWLDCEKFKTKFKWQANGTDISASNEEHEHPSPELVSAAFQIYNTYLAPASPSELNIDHSLRQEITRLMTDILSVAAGEGSNSKSSNDSAVAMPEETSVSPEALQTIFQIYEKVQGHIYRLMSTDSVPKFMKTKKYQHAILAQE